MGQKGKTQKDYWEGWLDPEMGDMLTKIRRAVKDIIEADEERWPPMAHFIPHGTAHCQAVEDLIHRLVPMDQYTKLEHVERYCLLASAWLHDLGMLRSVAEEVAKRNLSDDEIRRDHHLFSEKFVTNEWSRCGVSEEYKTVLGKLARFHRRLEDINECDEAIKVHNELVRLRLLASYLRLADALDIGLPRAPMHAYAICLAYDIPIESKLHWIKSRLVHSIDIDPKTHDIIVEFRIPYYADIAPVWSQRWIREKISSIEALVCDDLREELLNVRNIIRRQPQELPFYVDVQHREFQGSLESQILNDIRGLITNYDIMTWPTASKLMEIILITTASVIGFSLKEGENPEPIMSHPGNPDEIRNQLQEFLKTASTKILETRPSHIGVERLFSNLTRTINEAREPAVWIASVNKIYQEHCVSRNLVRGRAEQFFKEFCENKQTVNPKGFNILLYGNSELVSKALCGFRDHLLKLDGNKNPLKVFGAEVEREASRKFRLFICESQPKTQTAIGDRLTYHDGSQYALHLKRRGFTNIILIPDIVAANILEHLHIDFFLVGADGVTPDHFIHSAGHAVLVNLVHDFRSKKQATDLELAPQIILVTSRQKWSEETKLAPELSRNDGKEQALEKHEVKEGCRFWRGLPNGREHVWLARDAELLETLYREGVCFFNPKEDRIPIKQVDYIITDKNWARITEQNARSEVLRLFRE